MNRTVLKNDTTGKIETIYETRKTSFQFWVTLVAQMVAIAVVVFGVVRFGLQAETRDAIETELTPPSGIIFTGIHNCVDDHMEPVAEEMDVIKEQVIIATTVQKEIRSDIKEIKETVKEIHLNGT